MSCTKYDSRRGRREKLALNWATKHTGWRSYKTNTHLATTIEIAAPLCSRINAIFLHSVRVPGSS